MMVQKWKEKEDWSYLQITKIVQMVKLLIKISSGFAELLERFLLLIICSIAIKLLLKAMWYCTGCSFFFFLFYQFIVSK